MPTPCSSSTRASSAAMRSDVDTGGASSAKSAHNNAVSHAHARLQTLGHGVWSHRLQSTHLLRHVLHRGLPPPPPALPPCHCRRQNGSTRTPPRHHPHVGSRKWSPPPEGRDTKTAGHEYDDVYCSVTSPRFAMPMHLARYATDPGWATVSPSLQRTCMVTPYAPATQLGQH